MPETSYTETEVLLAMLREDADEAKRLLADMYPTELASLIDAAEGLVEYAEEARRVKRRELGDAD
ncbi:MAG TPA: hypothetical protein VGW74_14710 [Propionibacteriaceae bacterium]|nr:hypothetical protein [Propionibacteriaceae bacterium]